MKENYFRIFSLFLSICIVFNFPIAAWAEDSQRTQRQNLKDSFNSQQKTPQSSSDVQPLSDTAPVLGTPHGTAPIPLVQTGEYMRLNQELNSLRQRKEMILIEIKYLKKQLQKIPGGAAELKKLEATVLKDLPQEELNWENFEEFMEEVQKIGSKMPTLQSQVASQNHAGGTQTLESMTGSMTKMGNLLGADLEELAEGKKTKKPEKKKETDEDRRNKAKIAAIKNKLKQLKLELNTINDRISEIEERLKHMTAPVIGTGGGGTGKNGNKPGSEKIPTTTSSMQLSPGQLVGIGRYNQGAPPVPKTPHEAFIQHELADFSKEGNELLAISPLVIGGKIAAEHCAVEGVAALLSAALTEAIYTSPEIWVAASPALAFFAEPIISLAAIGAGSALAAHTVKSYYDELRTIQDNIDGLLSLLNAERQRQAMEEKFKNRQQQKNNNAVK